MSLSHLEQHRSLGRGIFCAADVERIANFESGVYNRLFLPVLLGEKEDKIYEAAVGPGILQCWMKNQGISESEGCDISIKEVDLAKLFNPRVVQDDAIKHLQERFSPNSFSAIVALDFYEHLEREDFSRFLEVAFSRLKVGGTLILRGPNGDSPLVGTNLYNDVTHVWAYTTQSLRDLLSIAGFSRVSFVDDAESSLHSGRWWKLPLMVVAQHLLTWTLYAASRVKIKYWGASLYIFARKENDPT